MSIAPNAAKARSLAQFNAVQVISPSRLEKSVLNDQNITLCFVESRWSRTVYRVRQQLDSFF